MRGILQKQICRLFVLTVALCAAGAARAQSQEAPGTPSKTQQPRGQGSKQDSQAGKQDSGGTNMPGMPGMPGMNMPGMDMSGMNMSKGAADRTEADAMRSMQPGEMMHMHMADGPHMHMTELQGPATPDDWKRADEIAATLRAAIEKYKDVRVAIRDGYRIFLPNIPQAEYHFNNAWNGFLETFTFDPARPTSLLYRKTPTGWELVGAMYTAPKTATLEQLNERIPLSVTRWHVHTNLCIPRQGADNPHADWKRFGLEGSISTPEACAAAGGRFYPQIFGWMTHVYPFEPTREKIWGQE